MLVYWDPLLDAADMIPIVVQILTTNIAVVANVPPSLVVVNVLPASVIIQAKVCTNTSRAAEEARASLIPVVGTVAAAETFLSQVDIRTLRCTRT